MQKKMKKYEEKIFEFGSYGSSIYPEIADDT